MFAATAAGVYDKVEDAMHVIGQGFDAEYFPAKENAIIYKKRYAKYAALGKFIEADTANS
jgi:L-ribulokinase